MTRHKFQSAYIRNAFLMVFCFTFLLLCGSKKVYAEGEMKAELYKNGVYQGNYTTVDAAFAAMTDSSADYEISMRGDQTLSRTSWPNVKSITIDGGTEGYQFLQLPDGDATLNCDVTLKNYVCLTPVLQDRSSYHCTNVNVQNYTFAVDGQPGVYTAIGYIWDYSDNYGYYINFTGGSSGNVVFKNQSQMFGTLNVNTVTLYDSITLWSPYNKGSNIQNCVQNMQGNRSPYLEVRTFGEASRLNIQNADAVDNFGTATFGLETGNNTVGSDCLVTIQNLSASTTGIILFGDYEELQGSDIRILSGLADKSIQVGITEYARISGNNESNSEIAMMSGTHLFYAPDFTGDNIYVTYEKQLWTETAPTSEISSITYYPETYMDNGYFCLGDISKFSLDQYRVLLSQNESTVVNVTKKDSSVGSVEWRVESGNIYVSGDTSKATITSTGAFTGAELVSYVVRDTSGTSVLSGWLKILDRSVSADNSYWQGNKYIVNGVAQSNVFLAPVRENPSIQWYYFAYSTDDTSAGTRAYEIRTGWLRDEQTGKLHFAFPENGLLMANMWSSDHKYYFDGLDLAIGKFVANDGYTYFSYGENAVINGQHVTGIVQSGWVMDEQAGDLYFCFPENCRMARGITLGKYVFDESGKCLNPF